MMNIRPSFTFITTTIVVAVVLMLSINHTNKSSSNNTYIQLSQVLVSTLSLTDLCITTEARYTRNPAISDTVAPFMDHPGSIEHFPSGSFFAPPRF